MRSLHSLVYLPYSLFPNRYLQLVDVTWKQFAVALEWLGSEAYMLIEAGLSAGLSGNIGAFNSLVGDDKTVLTYKHALFHVK